MMKMRAVVLLVAIYAVACATSTPSPKPAAAPIAKAKSPSAETLQAEEYRHALETAYGQIVAREGMPVVGPKGEIDAPRVDVEAAASIPMPDHPTIRGALQYFTTDLKPSIQESLIRSAKYKQLIDKALDEYKLPRRLAY